MRQLETGKEVIFEVALDAHSVELSYDLTKIATLKDNKGNAYEALSWEDGSGGHHLSGGLFFEAMVKDASSFSLKIEGLSDATGEFLWEI